MKILVTHPRQWMDTPMAKITGTEVRRVSIGGTVPKRLDGNASYDGIGEVAVHSGIEALLACAREFQPDFFLFGIHFKFPPEVLARVRQACANTKLIMHYTDQRSTVPRQVAQYRGLIDMLLVTNKDGREHSRYQSFLNAPVRLFYDGVDPQEYRPKAILPSCDCYFGGNDFYGLDGELMRKGMTQADMISKFPGSYYRRGFLELVNDRHSLVIRGQWGWDKSVFRVLPPLFCPYEVDGMLDARLILSTFNIKLHGLITRKILRSMASGRMLITEYCSGLDEQFENHKHLAWFETPEEGLDLIRYYLEHPTERDRIAMAARQLISKRHSFGVRLKEFTTIIREVFG